MEGLTKKLQSPIDLLGKLKWELDHLRGSPSDAYAAFNFFVTAEHMPDWLGDRSLRKANDVLKVVSHIANGAKHFKLDPKRHKSVTRIESRCDPWPDDRGVVREHIYISFCMDDGNFSGMEMDALTLAEIVYKFWFAKLNGKGT